MPPELYQPEDSCDRHHVRSQVPDLWICRAWPSFARGLLHVQAYSGI